MAGQDVFKGALGWDDWIWWAGISGIALFFFLLLICCCVCVQRAKRKGRAEAIASAHARQREDAQREQAQMRYAQAQQARYPPPPPPPHHPNQYNQHTQHSQHQERDCKYAQQHGASPAGLRGTQMGPQAGVRKNVGPQVMANAHYAAPPPPQPLPHQQQQHQYGAIPARHYQQQQQAAQPPQPHAPPAINPNTNYTRKPANNRKPWHATATAEAPYHVVDTVSGIRRSLEDASDVPFVAVTSPAAGNGDKRTHIGNATTTTHGGTTLRDRIDALRQEPVHETHARISGDIEFELPPIQQHRRSLVLLGTVLSSDDDEEQSEHSLHGERDNTKTNTNINNYKTARSGDDSNYNSDFSRAVAAAQSPLPVDHDKRGRNRIKSDDSRVSVEF